jgi:hypothetical protein
MHIRLHLGKLASGKFWNAVLQFVDPVVSVEYLNPFGIKDFETDKLVCVNVKATDQRGRVFIVEIQIVVQSSFAKRAVFYGSSPILVGSFENAVDSVSFWDERINH